MTSSTLPAGVYFATHYVDRQGQVENWHYYYDDGRVELADEDGMLLVYQFAAEHVAALKDAIVSIGQRTAHSRADSGVFDAGMLTYYWSVDGTEGMLTNRTATAGQPQQMAQLDAVLERLESQTRVPRSNS